MSAPKTVFPLASIQITAQKNPPRFSKAWFVAHTDHFIISIGSSLAVTLVVNAITHHIWRRS